ncbi:N-acetylmuramoyl-L-alanine amidase [Deinococcus sp. HSC-46F16]|uniref:N-acetylmuramoyl-L-alanine amidase family protein n=1 Tax=Deinococcus sp. HSC-46F16 TaxID=2910968 RepID=UPI00209EA124|nr:N-acetylmuramoyl-L-alanine amidase [Deinococcus sp. HSC-46F16]MCP2013653.1 N-acetylmuramoyl-L-alanine amidase [Deinococcus sp. HSC-46F16]
MRRPPSRLTLAAALLGAFMPTSAAFAAPDIFVAYPPPGHRVASDHVLLEGSVPPGATLRIDGRAAEVGPDGLFILWWPLRVGTQDLRLVSTLRGQTGTRTLRVTRTARPGLPATPTVLDTASIQPAQDHTFWDAAGDSEAERTVPVAFRGSPGGRASVRVGEGPATALREVAPGEYRGGFVLPPTQALAAAPVTVMLTGRDGRTVTRTAAGRVSNVPGAAPQLAVQRPGTVPGRALNPADTLLTTPSGEPLLYPREGMTFRAVGRVGPDLRVRLVPGQSALVTAAQVELRPGAPAPALAGALRVEGAVPVPTALVPALPLAAALPVLPPVPAPTGDLRLRLPLGGARVPFTLAQPEPGRLVLTVYGLATPPAPPQPVADPFLGGVEVSAPAPGVTRLALSLNAAQLWGFAAGYEEGDLVLSVRRPPRLDPARPLAGRVIVLDAGHGGTQNGGAGALRVPEKDLVLPITLRAAELLRAQGADVRLTRDGDVTLGLYERGLFAELQEADLLVSIHANALPDGRDPRGIRGPEVFFTHPQAQAPAAAILAALRRTLPDLGTGAGLKPGANLALTRPSAQPSLLVETGYLTDPGNLRLLMSPAGRERLAGAIASGIADFYAGQVRPGQP